MQKLTAKEEELICFFWEKGALFVKDILDFYEEIGRASCRERV